MPAAQGRGAAPAVCRLYAGGRFLAARAAVGALVALLVLLLGEPGAAVPRHGVSVGVLAWVAAGTWLLGAAGPLRRRPEGAFGLLLTGDSLAAAAAAWAAGGVAAPALLLIALPVLAGGLLFQCRVGLLLGALAGVLCGVLAWREGLPAGQGLWSAIAYHGAVFIAVGLGAGLLGRRTAASLREAAATRRELEEVRLSTDCIVESLASGLIAIDAQGRIGTVNAEARRLLDIGRWENPAPALESCNAALLDRIRSGEGDLAGADGRELEIARAGGAVFPAWMKIAPIVDAAGESHGRVALFWDLTERKRLEEAARRSERLAAVGELSAGLAHEIRNSLKPITGCIELLIARHLLGEAARPMCEIILREADSLEAFISQFLTLARDKTLKLESCDLEELIRNECRTLAVGMRVDDSRLAIDGPAGVCVQGDPDWLRLVFRNLILNALEALPGGRVRVTLAPVPEAARPAVRVTVADEGPGFGPLAFSEALKPFQTGKPAGTGLGLPIAWRGVQEHGGRLYLDGAVETGAALVVELPVEGPERTALRPAA